MRNFDENGFPPIVNIPFIYFYSYGSIYSYACLNVKFYTKVP